MDIAAIPIVDFLKYCKDGARNKGYYWIVCILSRVSDSKELYMSIKKDWQSLDDITGNRVLVLFAGNEIGSESELYDWGNNLSSCVTDIDVAYIKRYNPFATIIGNKYNIKANLSSVRYRHLQDFIDTVETTQTDAIQSLKTFLGIEEKDIPCLVYIPLYREEYPFNNIVVPIPEYNADLYKYFKNIYCEISPLIKQLSQNCEKPVSHINETYDQLIHLAEKSSEREILLKCIEEKIYYKCDQPIRGLLSRYIDLCHNYEKENGIPYVKESPELLRRIENIFNEVKVPQLENERINVYITIGDNNKIKNSHISINVQGGE